MSEIVTIKPVPPNELGVYFGGYEVLPNLDKGEPISIGHMTFEPCNDDYAVYDSERELLMSPQLAYERGVALISAAIEAVQQRDTP